AERVADHFADVLIVRSPVQDSDQLTQDVPARERMVAGGLTGNPARLDPGVVDCRDDLVPRRFFAQAGGGAEAGGVREDVTNRDLLLSASGELRDVLRNWVVEIEQVSLPKLCDCDGGERFAGGEPRHGKVAG